jgi:hypothetical protein
MPNPSDQHPDNVRWTLKDLNEFLRARQDHFPEVILDFYRNEKRLPYYSFRGELYYLRKKLLAERLKHYPPEREFYRLLFIALCDYYLGAYRYAARFLDMALALGAEQHLYPLVMEIKYSITRLGRTMVIVSLEDHVARNFLRLEDVDRRITVNIFSEYAHPAEMVAGWRGYDQVFLIGHGEESTGDHAGNVLIGNVEFSPEHLAGHVTSGARLPAVLGIFSCGNGFGDTPAKRHLDYYLTDTYSSVDEFLEMFLNGYLTEYYHSYSIPAAFQKGKLATVFRAVVDPSIVIYSRGIRL